MNDNSEGLACFFFVTTFLLAATLAFVVKETNATLAEHRAQAVTNQCAYWETDINGETEFKWGKD